MKQLTDFGSAKLCTQEEFLELSNVDDSLVATPDVTPITSEACAESPLQPPSSESTTKQHKRKASFVGTAEYCSPELLNDRACSPKSDIWALGVVTFQLLSGRHPFRGGSEYQTFQKVLHLEYVFTSDMSPEAKALLQEILVLQPRDRISIDGIKEHAFYAGLDWEGLKTAVAPPKRTWSRSRGSTHTNITILHGSDVTLSDMDAEDEEEVAVADSPLVESNLDQLSLSDKPVPSPVTISSTTKTVPPVASIPSILLELAVQGETCLRSGILRRVQLDIAIDASPTLIAY